MEVEIWLLAVVPILAVVALADSVVHFSAGLAYRIGITNDLWTHVAVLLLVSIAFFVWMFNTFDMQDAFAIVDYVDARYQVFRINMMWRLFIFDVSAIVVSMAATLFISIKQRRNILLGVLAGILGNIGTAIWMIRARRTP